jgi:predicted PurR-regulated permease PerM
VSKWVRAREAGLAILSWLIIIYIVFMALGHITTALLLLVMGALLAFVLSPVVDMIARRLPRWMAITIVYLVALALLGGVGYVVVSTAVAQLTALAQDLPGLLTTSGAHPSPIVGVLHRLGITTAQLDAARNQLLAWAAGAAGTVAGKAVPILTGVANALLDVVLIVVISVYLVIDGPRLVVWLRNRTPISQRSRVVFSLEILDRTVGGYVRGELLLASLIGLLVGAGMFFFGLPFALLLGMLAFFLEFIPILGVFISGAACVLVALSKGWPVALGVFVYFIFVHVIEGDVVGPRIIGRVLGLHPVAAILALIVGADLFGIWGALFASPVAGIIQAVVVALWSEWREGHPEDFPAATMAASPAVSRAESRTDAEETPRWGARWSRLLGRGDPTQSGASSAERAKAGPALSEPLSSPAAPGGRPDVSPRPDDANEPRAAIGPGRGRH